jgi:hypothetical protein
MATINLTWAAPTGANVIEQRVYRGITSGSLSLLASGLLPTTNTYSDTTVLDNTTYYYRIDSICTIGGPTPSNVATVTTPAPCAPATWHPKLALTKFTVDFNYILT